MRTRRKNPRRRRCRRESRSKKPNRASPFGNRARRLPKSCPSRKRNSRGGGADNHFLFAQINASLSGGLTFPPVPNTPPGTQTSVESIAINPGGTSTAQPLTEPLGPDHVIRKHIASEILVAGTMENIVDPCPPHVICAGLVAVIGDKVYVGSGSTPYDASGNPGPFTFTWSVYSEHDVIEYHDGEDLFLADVNGGGHMDLVGVTVVREQDAATPAFAVIVENLFGDEQGTF